MHSPFTTCSPLLRDGNCEKGSSVGPSEPLACVAVRNAPCSVAMGISSQAATSTTSVRATPASHSSHAAATTTQCQFNMMSSPGRHRASLLSTPPPCRHAEQIRKVAGRPSTNESSHAPASAPASVYEASEAAIREAIEWLPTSQLASLPLITASARASARASRGHPSAHRRCSRCTPGCTTADL